MRSAWEDGRECTDGFEAEDAAGLHGGFVNGGDGKGVGFFGRVGEETLRGGEIEGGGGRDKGEESGAFEIHLARNVFAMIQ